MLEHGEDRRHGAAEVVGVEGHGDVDDVVGGGAAVLAIAEGGGLPEEGEVRQVTVDEAQTDGGDGAEEGEEEDGEGQEANQGGGAPKDHPVERRLYVVVVVLDQQCH